MADAAPKIDWSKVQSFSDMRKQISPEALSTVSSRQVEPEQPGMALTPITDLGTSLLGRTIDVLSRFEYASANVAKDYILGKDFDWESVKQGITGKEKTTYGQLVDVMWPDWGPWKRKGFGFLLSIFADPTTYVPAGAVAKPLKMGKEAVAKTKIGKAIAKSPVAKGFVPSAGLPKDYYELKYYSKKALEARNAQILDDVSEIRKGLSKSDMEELAYFREHPNEAHLLSSKLQGKLEQIGDRFDELVHEAHQSGVIDADTAKKWLREPYVPHYYPERGLNLAKGEIPPSLFERVKRPSFLKHRTFATLEDAKHLSEQFDEIAKTTTKEEAGKLIKEYGLDGAFNKGQITNFEDLKDIASRYAGLYMPDENLLRAYGIRASEQAAYIARTKFVDDTLLTFGKKVKSNVKVAPEGYGIYYPKNKLRIFLKESIDPDIVDRLVKEHGDLIPAGELADAINKYPSITTKVPAYQLPEEIARDLNSATRFFGGDVATRKMFQMFDKAQNTWKGFATVWRLPFHLRNMYSNWWQAYLSGVKNPRRFVQAAELRLGTAGDTIRLGAKDYPVTQINDAINKLGVHGKGWIGSDIQRTHLSELESIIKYGKFRNMNPSSIGRAFGMAIEDNSRIAVFLDQIAKGKSFKDASRSVRKYLFDYTELTDFEKKVMRRLWPFYTWSRKNIPLQIESLITQPRKYQIYSKGTRAFGEPETIQEKKLKPRYFFELMYIKSPFKSEQGKSLYMAIDLPPLEFNRMASARHWVSSLSPIKIALEVGFNFKTFPELSKIQEQPLEKTRAPFWVMYLPEAVQEAMKENHIIDKVLNKSTGQYELGMDKKWVHAIQSAFPFMNELNRIYAQPITLQDESPQDKFKSYMTGIGFKSLDLGLQQQREAFDKMRYFDTIKRFVYQHGRAPTEEEKKI